MSRSARKKVNPVAALTPGEAVAVLAGPFKAGPPATKPKCDPRKASVYLPEAMLAEIHAEAKRQDRPISWLVQKAWKLARKLIQEMPGVS